jgi:ATP-dependent DNA helicase RecG
LYAQNDVQIVRTTGRGTLQIAGLMQEAGLQPPTVAVQGDCVVLTLRLAQSLAGKALGTGSGKTPGKIIEFVRQNPQVTIPELAAMLGITSRSVERNLQRLQAENLLTRIGPATGGRWQVLSNE